MIKLFVKSFLRCSVERFTDTYNSVIASKGSFCMQKNSGKNNNDNIINDVS